MLLLHMSIHMLVQETLLYPQIAERDEREMCTASWLQKIHEYAGDFDTWESAPLQDLSTKQVSFVLAL